MVQPELRTSPTPLELGAFIGFVNTLVVAVGLSAVEPRDRFGITLIVTLIGVIPAVLTGVVLGAIAKQLASARVRVRIAVLVPPALAVVGFLAFAFNMTSYFVLACIPTLASALYLERRTRAGAPLPVAVAK
jgi:hypothetical protein